MELGTRIKNLREEAGLTQLAFAKILNINNSTLSQYESGDRIPRDATKVNRKPRLEKAVIVNAESI